MADPLPNTQVTIPDVGAPAYSTALAGKITAAKDDVAARTTAANASTPTYTAPPPDAVDTIKDASTYQRPEDMVANQMASLLNTSNPYMRAAETRANEASQKYGLLGSSMSVGAAHRAAIESSLPIAQQDAQTSSKYGLQQQASENQIGAIGAETAYSGALMKTRMQGENTQTALKSQAELSAKGVDAETQIAAAELQGRWQFVANDAQLRLEASLKEQLNAKAIDADIATATRKSASEMIQNYQVGTEELLKDPDFLQLGATTVKATLNNMLKTTTASIQFLADSSGVNLDEWLDAFETNATFTATVNPPPTT